MKTFLTFMALFLASCASLVGGTQQKVAISTSPVALASCKLSNSKGEWEVPATPEAVKIHRAYGDLLVECRTESASGISSIPSSTKPLILGNLLLGGPIGALVDVGTGAGYEYPDTIGITLIPHAEEKPLATSAKKSLEEMAATIKPAAGEDN